MNECTKSLQHARHLISKNNAVSVAGGIQTIDTWIGGESVGITVGLSYLGGIILFLLPCLVRYILEGIFSQKKDTFMPKTIICYSRVYEYIKEICK